MPRWTSEQLKRKQQRNPHLQVVGAGEDAAPERTVRKDSLGKDSTKDPNPERFFVRIVSVRKRLSDPDGLVPKWHLDALRYAGVITDDTAEVLELSVSQRKCRKGEEETVEIEVYRLNASPSNVVSEDK